MSGEEKRNFLGAHFCAFFRHPFHALHVFDGRGGYVNGFGFRRDFAFRYFAEASFADV